MTTSEMLCDPWDGSARTLSDAPDDATIAPVGWWLLLPGTRGRVGGAIHALLAEHPERNQPGDVAFLAERLWERVREDPKTDADLSQVGIASPVLLLQVAIRKVMGAGTLADTLRARIARDQALLARLTSVGGAR